MIITLFFGGEAPGLNDVLNNRLLVGQHAFAVTFRANESGERVRVYKPLKNLTFAEVEEMAEQHAALDAYYEHRYSEARYALSTAEDLIQELTEVTMCRAWPGASFEERQRIVRAALIQYRQYEEAKRRFKARFMEEGFDLDRFTEDYLQTAVDSRSDANIIADDFTAYLILATDLEGIGFADINLRMGAEAYMYTLYEFARGEGMSMREAAQEFGGEFGEHVNLFAEALSAEEQDLFDRTLDEHLQFAVGQTEV
jgi:hypothetical protein